jgi:hypothetical protein
MYDNVESYYDANISEKSISGETMPTKLASRISGEGMCP